MQKTIRMIALLLAVLFVTGTVMVNAESKTGQFTDLKNDWSLPYIEWCLEHDIMAGTSPTTFSPNGAVTRSMFVTVLARIAGSLGYNMNGYVWADVFPDVGKRAWYAKEVTWGYKNGVVSGLGDGSFGSDDPLTRQDMAVLLYRFLKYYLVYDAIDTDETAAFTDSKSINSYARASVNALAVSGLMSGSGGKFNPKAGAKRSEMASVLKRLSDFIEEKGAVTDLSRLKFGINAYTYEHNARFPIYRDGEVIPSDPDTVMAQIRNAGYDYVRLPIAVTEDRLNDDSTKTENAFVMGEDGRFHITTREDVLDGAVRDAKAAADHDLAIIIDLHIYSAYASVINNREAIAAELRTLAQTKSEWAYADTFLQELSSGEEEASYYVRHLYEYILPIGFEGKFSEKEREYLYRVKESPVFDPDLFGELWGKIAEVFKDVEGSIFFELINERSLTNEAVIEATRAIRATGGYNTKRNVIVYSYCWQAYREDGREKKNVEKETWDFGEFEDDPYIIFDVHNYEPYGYTYGESGSGKWRGNVRYPDNLTARFKAAADLQQRTGRHVIFGEFGVHRGVNEKAEYLRDYVKTAAQYHFPICLWCCASAANDPFVIYNYYNGEWYENNLSTTAIFN